MALLLPDQRRQRGDWLRRRVSLANREVSCSSLARGAQRSCGWPVVRSGYPVRQGAQSLHDHSYCDRDVTDLDGLELRPVERVAQRAFDLALASNRQASQVFSDSCLRNDVDVVQIGDRGT